MSEALYRKYRPQTFKEVLGQDVVKTILQNALKLGRVSHAYLFCGPRGVGKTTLARILAKAVNCLSPQGGEPDTTCENCQLSQTGRFLDILEIDAASYTGVDNIRDIIDHVKFAPSRGKFKVFIIDEVHMLSKAAFNALLKTLEEPPAHAIFILATTEVHKVPATIISRCQRFDFRKIARQDITGLLIGICRSQNIRIAGEALNLVAAVAQGSFRDALSMLDQLASFGGDEEITFEKVEETLGIARIETSQTILDFVTGGDAAGGAKFVKTLADEGRDMVQVCRGLLEYLRLLLFVKTSAALASTFGLSDEDQAKLEAQSLKVTSAQLLVVVKKILEAFRETKESPIPELSLLSAVIDLAGKQEPSSESPSPKIGSVQTVPFALDLGSIIDGWAAVCSRIKDYNHSLLSSLRLGRLVRLDGLDLVLAFPYNFHKETIEARKNRIVVEQVLEEVFNHPLKVKVYLERDLEGRDLLSEAVKVLGSS